MSQCTCTKDKEMTCIVHPTERSLKERIAELKLSLIHISEPTRQPATSRMPSSA